MPDVAIRIPILCYDIEEMFLKKNGLPHQCAPWFAMTSVVSVEAINENLPILTNREVAISNYWFAISLRASLREKFARPFSSKPMNLTQVMSPRFRTSSTFSTRRFSSLEMCTMPS